MQSYLLTAADYTAICACNKIVSPMVICDYGQGPFVGVNDINSAAFASQRSALDALQPMTSRTIMDMVAPLSPFGT